MISFSWTFVNATALTSTYGISERTPTMSESLELPGSQVHKFFPVSSLPKFSVISLTPPWSSESPSAISPAHSNLLPVICFCPPFWIPPSLLAQLGFSLTLSLTVTTEQKVGFSFALQTPFVHIDSTVYHVYPLRTLSALYICAWCNHPIYLRPEDELLLEDGILSQLLNFLN